MFVLEHFVGKWRNCEGVLEGVGEIGVKLLTLLKWISLDICYGFMLMWEHFGGKQKVCEDVAEDVGEIWVK